MSSARRAAKRAGSAIGARDDDEAFEIVVIVRELEIVAGRTLRDVVLGGCFEAEQHARRQRAVRCVNAGDARSQPFPERAPGRRERVAIHQVGLVEHGEIGRHELIAEHFLDRVVMRGKAGAGRRLSEAARERRSIDHGDNAIDRDARLDLGPVERLQQRFRQREARGLDDDMIGALRRIEEARQRRQKILGDGAADAAVRELDHLVVGARIAAREQQLAIDAELAELVDEKADAAARGMGE